MKSIRSILFVVTALALTSPLFAEDKKPRVSPHETVNASVGDAKITIVYGRPYMKDPKSGEKRKIWGGLVPYGKVWRLGADEATILTTDKDISIGGTAIKAGLLEGRRITADEVKRLATLPSREALLAQLGGAFQAPMAGFVGAMNGLLYQWVGALEALRVQRESAA